MPSSRKARPPFGELVFKFRKRVALSQEALAELVSTSYTTIHNYETGKSRPNNRDMVILLARVFVEPDRIITAKEVDALIRTRKLVHGKC